MGEETLKAKFSAALDEAIIEIWEPRSMGIEIKKPCPLCCVTPEPVGCEGCPVDNLTGHSCATTPYQNWDNLQFFYGADDPSTIEQAQKELALLEYAKKAFNVSSGK